MVNIWFTHNILVWQNLSCLSSFKWNEMNRDFSRLGDFKIYTKHYEENLFERSFNLSLIICLTSKSIISKLKKSQFHFVLYFWGYLDAWKHPKLFYRYISVFPEKSSLPVLFSLHWNGKYWKKSGKLVILQKKFWSCRSLYWFFTISPLRKSSFVKVKTRYFYVIVLNIFICAHICYNVFMFVRNLDEFVIKVISNWFLSFG